METSYYISIAIKKFLDERGMKSYHLALASGCNKTAVNSWLYQRQEPSSQALMRLADYMNVSLDYMLGRTKNKSIILTGTPDKFGRRLFSIPLPEGMSYYKLAHICGMGTSGLSKWRDLKRVPKLDVLIKLADYFGCSVDYLVGRTNIPYMAE
ncbi:MAG: helix-turn-helix domain-containing protein [Clostridia bacterium]|nr:helix-turn-helix domain-containing protein [Clostridia bacterium]MBQ7224713.1 helix-turn-helix domain-containing protein [Clostridia bacterium]MBR6773491.1 helix-turn-helix domain-containing protein [Clostridia bacterium]